MNFKHCIIVCLCPIPNFIILFYYLISVKILMEENSVVDCHYIYNYNILSYIFFVVSNIYLMLQLCYDKPKIFYYNLDYHFLFQVIWYSMLSILIIIGLTFLIDYSNCYQESNNLFNLAITNCICQLIMWMVCNGLVIYYTQFQTQIVPINNTHRNILRIKIEV